MSSYYHANELKNNNIVIYELLFAISEPTRLSHNMSESSTGVWNKT